MKKIGKNNDNKIFFYWLPLFVIVIILIFLPFQAFLQTWLRFKFQLTSGQAFFISLWKEYLLLILLVIVVIKTFIRKKLPFKLLLLDKIILGFFLLAFICFLLFGGTLGQKILGLRYDLEFLVVYFLARSFNLKKSEIKTLLTLFLGAAIFSIIFGLLQISLLPPSFLVSLGYSKNMDIYSQTGIIPTYDSIHPFLPNFYRIQSTFPGALQFSSYLTLVMSITFALTLFIKKKKKVFLGSLFFISLIALFATYARSAWLGFLVSVFVMLFIYVRKKIYVILPAAISVFLGLILVISLFNVQAFQTLILHGEVRDGGLFGSTQAHQSAFTESIKLAIQNPLGIGVGAAGPASKATVNVIIPENWYLQIVLELGIAGLVIFVSIIYFLFRKLLDIFKNSQDNFYKMLSLGLIGSLVGVSVSSLFLHTWADTPAVYSFWIFAGLVISSFESSSLKNNSPKSLQKSSKSLK